MAGGIKAQRPGELAPLFQRLDDIDGPRGRLTELERPKTGSSAPSVSNVIIQSPNGTSWRLGVTDAGATTWTAV